MTPLRFISPHSWILQQNCKDGQLFHAQYTNQCTFLDHIYHTQKKLCTNVLLQSNILGWDNQFDYCSLLDRTHAHPTIQTFMYQRPQFGIVLITCQLFFLILATPTHILDSLVFRATNFTLALQISSPNAMSLIHICVLNVVKLNAELVQPISAEHQTLAIETTKNPSLQHVAAQVVSFSTCSHITRDKYNV